MEVSSALLRYDGGPAGRCGGKEEGRKVAGVAAKRGGPTEESNVQQQGGEKEKREEETHAPRQLSCPTPPWWLH